MDNNELLKEMKGEFERHMGTLLEQHKKEVKIVGEGHSILLKKIEELDAKVEANQKRTEMRLDRHDKRFDQIEKKIDTAIKQNDLRFKRIEEKVGI